VLDAVLVLHVAGGSAGLALGLVALALPKRPAGHPRVGAAYQAAVAVTCTTAVALAVVNPSVWWLGLVALATWAAALRGWAVRRSARPGWVSRHLRLMGTSYIALATAFLVVNSSGWWAWVLPTAVGSPLLHLAARRVGRAEQAPADDVAPVRPPATPRRGRGALNT
jgi:hypothetical protein